jgi:citrate/tricarballylate utilization protein
VPGLEHLLAEADRQFSVCNACRYCEGYCAAFPAMELRSAFTTGDLAYIANLCHDCRACHQACMYTEPHDFALNIPQLMAAARAESYTHYARPRRLTAAFERGPLTLAALTVALLAVITLAYAALGSIGGLFETRRGPGAFYEVVPHAAMAASALALGLFGFAVAGLGVRAFLRDQRSGPRIGARAWLTALRETATMRWMRGGGDECYYPTELQASPARRRLHALVMWGFLATFAATVAAFLYEWVLGLLPPYGLLSLPVLLGLGGGVAVTVASAMLLRLKLRGHRHLTTPGTVAMDATFLVALLAVSVTGLALLGLRDTPAMGTLLLVHLATVAALYLTAPYGKFVHAVYRFGAILRSAAERRSQGTPS